MSQPVANPLRSTAGASPPHPTWTVFLASIGVLMTALGALVVTTSLSVLRVSLHASLSSRT
jgi:hypothetical protein